MSEKVFEKAKWIWIAKEAESENEYAEFGQNIYYGGGKVNVRFSVSGEYTLFVNGFYVTSVQYADFECYKVYEDVDISRYLREGDNFVCFLCVYWGKSGMRYNTPSPGLIYEITVNDEIKYFSDENTFSRKSAAYVSGWPVKISSQLGYSFKYDMTKEDDWCLGKAWNGKFSKSGIIEKNCNFVKRPIKPQKAEEIRHAKRIGEKNRYLFDLGEELVGFCHFALYSKTEQDIKVFYGELLKDGQIKKTIGSRNFRFDYRTVKGRNEFTNYMLRLACRYIEIECEDEIDVEFIGIHPHTYPAVPLSKRPADELDRRIYDICLNTMRISMLEHYVDCPWREQCLYAFDSRNQMLTGYYAFEGGNTEYARANLLLMSKDNREDGIMSICFPSQEDLTIPSFCLYYIIAVNEYLTHTNDLSLAEDVFDKMTSVLSVFVSGMKDGLVCKFTSKSHWNFYDWSEYATGTIFASEEAEPDCLVNAIAVLALKAYDEICRKLHRGNPYGDVVEKIIAGANKKFFNAEKGVYFVIDSSEEPTELVNSLCVLSGIADGERAEMLCEKLTSGELVECSLSMKTFKYDALLKTDGKYREYILDEIRKIYKAMLDAGSTTVWETAEGESAFSSAGSLCHGWSAVPIYYYHLFGLTE